MNTRAVACGATVLAAELGLAASMGRARGRT